MFKTPSTVTNRHRKRNAVLVAALAFDFGCSVVTIHNHLVQCRIELVAIGMAVDLDGCIEPSEWVHPIHYPSIPWFLAVVLAVSLACSQAGVRLLGQIYRA